jgi:DNA repair exonuclease SbcCD nuclease subunit
MQMIQDMILISDLHLTMEKPVSRIDDVKEEQDRMLRFIGSYAVDNGIKTILQAGDFVDQKRSWELMQYLSVMLRTWKERGITVYSVMGQHDSYYHNMTNEKTVMGVLFSSGLVKRLTSSPVVLQEARIYGASYGEPVQTCLHQKGNYSMLVVHAPILWKKAWKQQEEFIYAPDAARTYKHDLILCGDQHHKFLYHNDNAQVVLNTGPMMRLKANERDHKPGFYHFEGKTAKLKWVELPYEKDCWSVLHLEREKHQEEMFEKFTSRLTEGGGSAPTVSFDKKLRGYFTKHKTKGSVQQIISEKMASTEG